jgi:hypothetical protein
MRKFQLVVFSLLLCTVLFAQRGVDPPEFYLQTSPEDIKANRLIGNTKVRRADFIPANYEVPPDKKTIDRLDPGSTGHLTLTWNDVLSLHGYNDSLDQLLRTPGALVYTFENTDLVDSVGFLKLVQDSTIGSMFLSKVLKVRKREWELFRMTIRRKGSDKKFQVILRYTKSIFTVNLPDKSNRESIKINSIAPSIPVIHLGSIDYESYKPGPGIAINFGLIPRRPLPRLMADIVGPVSFEVMFSPISSLEDALAIRCSGIGFFFNSFYGILHWGVAIYDPTYSRAEAYIGLNLAPAITIFNGGRKQRYRW